MKRAIVVGGLVSVVATLTALHYDRQSPRTSPHRAAQTPEIQEPRKQPHVPQPYVPRTEAEQNADIVRENFPHLERLNSTLGWQGDLDDALRKYDSWEVLKAAHTRPQEHTAQLSTYLHSMFVRLVQSEGTINYLHTSNNFVGFGRKRYDVISLVSANIPVGRNLRADIEWSELMNVFRVSLDCPSDRLLGADIFYDMQTGRLKSIKIEYLDEPPFSGRWHGEHLTKKDTSGEENKAITLSDWKQMRKSYATTLLLPRGDLHLQIPSTLDPRTFREAFREANVGKHVLNDFSVAYVRYRR